MMKLVQQVLNVELWRESDINTIHRPGETLCLAAEKCHSTYSVVPMLWKY
jgi:hypothetical protein